MARESPFGFSVRSASRPKTFTHVPRHSSEMLLTASTVSGASGSGASMFDKDAKTCMTVRFGRPPNDFLDIRILALLDEQPFHSVYSIPEVLCVSHSTILNQLRQSLRVKNFHLRWIPHELTTSSRQIRMETCRELLPILKRHEKRKVQRVMTEDESSFWNFVILRNRAYRKMMSLER
jgi:hypothetical protein